MATSLEADRKIPEDDMRLSKPVKSTGQPAAVATGLATAVLTKCIATANLELLGNEQRSLAVENICPLLG